VSAHDGTGDRERGRDVPARDAATIMLVRDGAHDERPLEVFMLRRNLRSDFVGGAYVFPGGAVDQVDRADELGHICEGRTDADASTQLGIPVGGLAFWVAAIRESFEEAGVLLAYDADGVVVRFDDPEVDARFIAHRTAVDNGTRRLVEVCEDEKLRLAVDGIHYFSHWITPEGAPRRYDTRFFVGRAPEAQVPLHDDHEVIANLWVRPRDALDRQRDGELEMIFPTIRSLEALARFDTADDLLAATATSADIPAVLPRVVDDGGGVRIVLPGDPGYDDLPAADISGGLPRAPDNRGDRP
jgi:8-oxo-dGTP pyrophosphatase MutT (NUDIX family)